MKIKHLSILFIISLQLPLYLASKDDEWKITLSPDSCKALTTLVKSKNSLQNSTEQLPVITLRDILEMIKTIHKNKKLKYNFSPHN